MLQATEDIHPGDEIWVTYGGDYFHAVDRAKSPPAATAEPATHLTRHTRRTAFTEARERIVATSEIDSLPLDPDVVMPRSSPRSFLSLGERLRVDEKAGLILGVETRLSKFCKSRQLGIWTMVRERWRER